MGPSSAFGQLLLGLPRFPVNRPMSSRKRRTSFLKSVYEASGLFLPDVYIVCGTGEAELEPRRPGVQASFLSCQTTMTTNWQIFCFYPLGPIPCLLAFLQGHTFNRRAPARSSLQPQNDPHVLHATGVP
ncbi:hypothetical protein BDQ94DRAFT_163903 [Aspergillus welwitschiae]|uniref:Uncharacterized protein n=1 Tax=Aspergillus welwitschiae TaxID=1341132 RepID=A0A3F3PJK9_9EURO|nr:hypothetical protein BDQ94DRAFT_163903 [Aspergillus welwitschiae]RDH27134.1 hypothetical protein BDQ94DRAFT_163903 [Aspergillus welwitschiae]